MIYKFIFLLIVTNVLSHHSQSQEYYQTSKGHLMLSVISKDHIIQKHFDNLYINIDYQNAKISWTIKDINSKAISETSYQIIDSIPEGLSLSSIFGSHTLEYTGKLNLEYIKTESHPPQPFIIEGILKMGEQQKPVKGSGLITHTETGDYACMLEMIIQDTTFQSVLKGQSQTFEVKFQIIQSLLKINNSIY